MIIKFCLVFPKIFLLHKVVRDAKKVEKHWIRVPGCRGYFSLSLEASCSEDALERFRCLAKSLTFVSMGKSCAEEKLREIVVCNGGTTIASNKRFVSGKRMHLWQTFKRKCREFFTVWNWPDCLA